jgi:hypothetical protein
MFEGVYDFKVLVLWGWYDMRRAEDAPRSARLPPDEERANMG